MSTFSVKPNALRAYAGTISGAGGSVGGDGINLAHIYIQRPDTYVDSYVRIDTGSGISDLFKVILDSNSTLVSHLHTTYGGIWPKLSQTGVALSTSASDYETTDQSVNEKMDSVWHGAGKTTPLDDEASGGEAEDPSEPLDETPESEVEIPDPVHWIMDQAGWFSIGNDVLKVASLFGLDPSAALTKAVLGDYGMVARAGHACKGLAEFERNTAQTVAAGLAEMTASWTGNAADAATSYFHAWANALDAHADQLDAVSSKYEELAQACAQVSLVVSGYLSKAIDALVIAAGSLAAAGCLEAVPGVDVIADIIGAYEAWRAKETVELFMKTCDDIFIVAESVVELATAIPGLCAPGDRGQRLPLRCLRERSAAMSAEDDLADLPDAVTAAGGSAPEVDFSAIASICDHDPHLIRRLRASLAVIARRTDDASLRQLAVSALRGTVSVRRVFEHPEFGAMASRSADNLAEGIARLTDEEREAAWARFGHADTSEATEFALMEGRPVAREEPPRPR